MLFLDFYRILYMEIKKGLIRISMDINGPWKSMDVAIRSIKSGIFFQLNASLRYGIPRRTPRNLLYGEMIWKTSFTNSSARRRHRGKNNSFALELNKPLLKYQFEKLNHLKSTMGIKITLKEFITWVKKFAYLISSASHHHP